MKNRVDRMLATTVALALFSSPILTAPVAAEEAKVVRAVKMDAEKLAGIGLAEEETFIAPENVLDGNHRPRGEVLYYGEQLIMEVYEDDPATFRIADPFVYDEFVVVLNGKLILTGSDGVAQEFVAGDSLLVPKGFTGTWQMLGNYRELIAIERDAYEEAYGVSGD